MTTITLSRHRDGWIAEWSGDEAEETRKLFGTTRIPTAFTVRAPVAHVYATIKALNPECNVVLPANWDCVAPAEER